MLAKSVLLLIVVSLLPLSSHAVEYDFDGDGKADVGVRRVENATWYIKNTSGIDEVTNSENGTTRKVFGRQSTDIPVAADYDGDGKTDIAFRRPSNFTWYIINSSGVDSITNNEDGITRFVFGKNASDIPVPADYDGDGKADIAVRRPSNFIWYIRNSSGVDELTNKADGISRIAFGRNSEDIPVPADYDGDGKADVAVRRPSNYFWYIRTSSGVDTLTNNQDGIIRKKFGVRDEDIATPADYDGDGKADIAFRRPSKGTWYVFNSSKTNFNSDRGDGIQRIAFGKKEEDIPIMADYDGDGYTDFAVRRPSTGLQYIKNSSGDDTLTENSDGISRLRFGKEVTDIPVAAPILTKMAMVSTDNEVEEEPDPVPVNPNLVLSLKDPLQAIKPMSTVVIEITGAELTSDTLEGTFNGEAYTYQVIEQNEFVIVIPTVSPGNYELTVNIGNEAATQTIGVESAAFSSDEAQTVLATQLESVRNQLDATIASLTASGIAQTQINELEDLKELLRTESELLSELTQEEIYNLALFFEQNLLMTEGQSKYFHLNSIDNCRPTSREIRRQTAIAILAGTGTYLAVSSLNPLLVPVASIAAVVSFSSLQTAVALIPTLGTACFDPFETALSKAFSKDSSNKLIEDVILQRRAKGLEPETITVFAGRPENLSFVRVMEISDENRVHVEDVISKVNELIGLANQIFAFVGEDNIPDAALEAFGEPVSIDQFLRQPISPSVLSFGDPSSSNVTGGKVKAYEDDSLDLEYNFTDEYNTESIDFEVEITDTGVDPVGKIIQPFRISVGPPIAYDVSYAMTFYEGAEDIWPSDFAFEHRIIDEPKYGFLNTYYSGFIYWQSGAINALDRIETPPHGIVTDSFTFVAINDSPIAGETGIAGESNIATVEFNFKVYTAVLYRKIEGSYLEVMEINPYDQVTIPNDSEYAINFRLNGNYVYNEDEEFLPIWSHASSNFRLEDRPSNFESEIGISGSWRDSDGYKIMVPIQLTYSMEIVRTVAGKKFTVDGGQFTQDQLIFDDSGQNYTLILDDQTHTGNVSFNGPRQEDSVNNLGLIKRIGPFRRITVLDDGTLIPQGYPDVRIY